MILTIGTPVYTYTCTHTHVNPRPPIHIYIHTCIKHIYMYQTNNTSSPPIHTYIHTHTQAFVVKNSGRRGGIWEDSEGYETDRPGLWVPLSQRDMRLVGGMWEDSEGYETIRQCTMPALSLHYHFAITSLSLHYHNALPGGRTFTQDHHGLLSSLSHSGC